MLNCESLNSYGVYDNWWGGENSSTGWTLGGGVEYAFTNNWMAKIEGLYVQP
jgi:opacity protein-like surface antigen